MYILQYRIENFIHVSHKIISRYVHVGHVTIKYILLSLFFRSMISKETLNINTKYHYSGNWCKVIIKTKFLFTLKTYLDIIKNQSFFFHVKHEYNEEEHTYISNGVCTLFIFSNINHNSMSWICRCIWAYLEFRQSLYWNSRIFMI